MKLKSIPADCHLAVSYTAVSLSRSEPAKQTSDRNRVQGQLRRIQYYQPNSLNNNHRGPDVNFIAENGRMNRGLEGFIILTPRSRHLTPAMKAGVDPHLGQTPARILKIKCR